jgi:hypothetical protein
MGDGHRAGSGRRSAELQRKLQLPVGTSLELRGRPDVISDVLRKDLEAIGHGDDLALLFVVRTMEQLTSLAPEIVAAADGDRLTWVSYPKAGQLDTNLNRDVLASLLIDRGVRPVRQVALDTTWSALRFRPH